MLKGRTTVIIAREWTMIVVIIVISIILVMIEGIVVMNVCSHERVMGAGGDVAAFRSGACF